METPHRRYPSSCSSSSFVSRRQQKNTKLQKTYPKKCNSFKSKVKFPMMSGLLYFHNQRQYEAKRRDLANLCHQGNIKEDVRMKNKNTQINTYNKVNLP